MAGPWGPAAGTPTTTRGADPALPDAAWLGEHSTLAYAILASAAFLEAVPGLGMFVPGGTLVVAAGIAASQGLLSPTAVVLWAATGAVVGDVLAYLAGRRFMPESKVARYGAALTKRLAGHPAVAVFVSRFVPPARGVAPLVAGATGLRTRTFVPVALAGAAVWAAVSAAAGFYGGVVLTTLVKPPGSLALAGVLVAALLGAELFRARRRAARLRTASKP